MASASLLTLLDDIATLLDDVSYQTSKAASKTAALVGDDLALNAKQLIGIDPKKELPIIWKVTKGSLVNKAILVPAALLISAFLPWAIQPILMLGGLYLCFEGVEKIHHVIQKKADKKKGLQHQKPLSPTPEREKARIKGAIRTDFILSAEIIAISLAAVSDASFPVIVLSLIGIAIGVTAFIYGLVAIIVKIDDVGLHLAGKQSVWKRKAGHFLIAFAPKFMKFLSWAGTLAMFMVGGEILTHGIPPLEHFIYALKDTVYNAAPFAKGIIKFIFGLLIKITVGVFFGLCAVAVHHLFHKVKHKFFSHSASQP